MKNAIKTRDGATIEWRGILATLHLSDDGWEWRDEWNADSEGPFRTANDAERSFRRHAEDCRANEAHWNGHTNPNRQGD